MDRSATGADATDPAADAVTNVLETEDSAGREGAPSKSLASGDAELMPQTVVKDVSGSTGAVLAGPDPEPEVVSDLDPAIAPGEIAMNAGPAQTADLVGVTSGVSADAEPIDASFDATGGLEDAQVRAGVSRETRSVVGDLPKPDHTHVFVVANQKGGVGKTTTTVNVAASLAMGGLSVLVIDLDPQGNASTALGVDHAPGTPGTYDVLMGGKRIDDLTLTSPESDNLSVLPATIDLAGAEIELVSVVARENRLLRAIKTYLTDNPCDYLFLDCPPSLGLLTLNALVAANEILIPIQCEYYALEGVSQLIRTIDLVKGELNDALDLSTVLLTMYDARTRLAAQVADEVRTHFSAQTLPVVIPRSVRISEAPSYGQTVITYQPDSAGAQSYIEAAREIARRGAAQTEESA